DDTFNEYEIARLDPSVPHHVEFSIDFADGPDNDVADIYIDGALTFSGTTWESYYRYDSESNPSHDANYVPTVRTMLFRAGGDPVPANAGKGYLIDNLTLSSGDASPASAASCPAGTTQSASPVQTVAVDSHSPAAAATAALPAGQYLFVSSGTWQNGGINAADTAFASVNSWLTHFSGYNIAPYFLGANEFKLMVDGAFVNWGAYAPTHSYSYLYAASGAPASLMIFDGDSHGGPGAFDPGWYGDNAGSLSVAIYPCTQPAPQYVQVHIAKYIDGAHATAANAGGASFSMQATYAGTSEEYGAISGTDPYPLNAAGNYEAATLHFAKGFHYGTSENLDATTGATCAAGKPFALLGYKVGDTLADAQGAATTATAPDFASLQGDEYVIVLNTKCPVLGSISGMKYDDLNRNGRKDPNEPGLKGWTMRLIRNDRVIATQVTDANGNYTFANLPAGTYVVRETHQKGWKRQSKNPKPIVLTAGAAVTDVSFGNAQTRRGEKDDDDRDDNRDDQQGSYYTHGDRSDYGQHENDRDRGNPW
ncbi:MAG TPA: SdrD B-like domain-containing protein, partial [Vicinamibacterales bacterium]|nr:SdrD B-like domain-containing protein [Vicinamibacterales bacterium]